MSQEEKKMPMYTSYQTFLISVECHITVAWTTNMDEVESFMPLPKHMVHIFLGTVVFTFSCPPHNITTALKP